MSLIRKIFAGTQKTSNHGWADSTKKMKKINNNFKDSTSNSLVNKARVAKKSRSSNNVAGKNFFDRFA